MCIKTSGTKDKFRPWDGFLVVHTVRNRILAAFGQVKALGRSFFVHKYHDPEFWQLLDKFRPWDWFLVVHEHRIRILIEFWQLLDKLRPYWFQVVFVHKTMIRNEFWQLLDKFKPWDGVSGRSQAQNYRQQVKALGLEVVSSSCIKPWSSERMASSWPWDGFLVSQAQNKDPDHFGSFWTS